MRPQVPAVPVRVTLAAGFAVLTLGERVLVLAALATAALPPALSAFADAVDPAGESTLGLVGLHPWGLAAAGAALSLALLLALERPRSFRVRAYAAQLRARLESVHSRVARAQLDADIVEGGGEPPNPRLSPGHRTTSSPAHRT
jgi:hypothetical protein